jgi:hypothetical protein
MANTDKDILITPNDGSSTDDPKIEFKGADASTTAQTITATVYPTNSGTLSFDGSAGQLFSITNDMSGTIFSVNDVSGIPSIEVDDDGTIRLAEYSGNILVGTATDDGSSKLQVNGTTSIDGVLKLETTSDQAFEMRQLSTKANDWNYISFFGRDGTRDAYVGTDADGDLMLYSDKNSSYIEMAASPNINGNVIVHAGNVSSYVGGPTLTATASGAISNGDTCCVNTDGTVSAIASSAVSQGATTPATTGGGVTYYSHMAINSAGTILAVFADSNYYLSAQVGTDNNDGTVTWGTKATLLSNNIQNCRVAYIPSLDRFLVVYHNNSLSSRTYAGVITISGTTPSFTAGGYATNVCFDIDVATNTDTNNVFGVCKSNNQPRCFMARIDPDNTTTAQITSADTINYTGSGTFNDEGVTYDSSVQRAVVTWQNSSRIYAETIENDTSSNWYGRNYTSQVLINGSYLGSFDTSNSIGINLAIASNGAGKACVIYDTTSGTQTRISQLSVTASGVSLDGVVTLDSDESYEAVICYDSNTDTFLCVYETQDGNTQGKVATIGGSGVTLSSQTTIETSANNPVNMSAIFSTVSNRGLFLYYDNNASNVGTYNFFNNAYTSTNLTTENYIGIADAAYSNGATATIQIVGSVDDAQSSLTAGQQYYVQLDGSLGLAPATGKSVFAGTAVSATKIIVKG